MSSSTACLVPCVVLSLLVQTVLCKPMSPSDSGDSVLQEQSESGQITAKLLAYLHQGADIDATPSQANSDDGRMLLEELLSEMYREQPDNQLIQSDTRSYIPSGQYIPYPALSTERVSSPMDPRSNYHAFAGPSFVPYEQTMQALGNNVGYGSTYYPGIGLQSGYFVPPSLRPPPNAQVVVDTDSEGLMQIPPISFPVTPMMMTYEALRTAKLRFSDKYPKIYNPYDYTLVEYPTSCFRIKEMAGYTDNGHNSWVITIFNKLGEEIFRGICLQGEDVVIKPGYTIHLKYERQE